MPYPRLSPLRWLLAAGMLLCVLVTAAAPPARAAEPGHSATAAQRAAARARTACKLARRPAATHAQRARCTTRRRQAASARRAAAADQDTPTAAPAPAPASTPAPAAGRLYSADSPFNVPIGPAPKLAPRSAAMVRASVAPFVGNANLANNDWWGVAIVQAQASDPLRVVSVLDGGYGGEIVQPPVRIPDDAQPTRGDDHHLAVFDGDKELDLWAAKRTRTGGWAAGARVVTSLSGDGVAGEIAGNAAGFALAAGIVRPEEIAAGRIDHALQFTSPFVHEGFVAPAVHGDGHESGDAMPMGTRIQLDPAVDVSDLPTTQRIIAQALKDYGAYLTDTGGSLALYAEASIGRASQGGPKDIWTPVGVTDPSLRDIPWSRTRVIAP